MEIKGNASHLSVSTACIDSVEKGFGERGVIQLLLKH